MAGDTQRPPTGAEGPERVERRRPGALSRLLRVGTIADSIAVYVPAKILQKGLGLVRLLVFMYLMTRTQYGLWGLGMFLFTVVGPILSLGSHHGLTRYAGLFEVRGQLRAFCRRMQWAIPLVTLALTAGAFAASDALTRLFIVSRHGAEGIGFDQQRMVCRAALANALVLAWYYNLLGLMYGLRTYRLAAAVEVLFSVAFAVFGVAALWVSPTGLAALTAHLAALVVSLVAGLAAVHVGLDRLAEAAQPPAPPAGTLIEADPAQAAQPAQTLHAAADEQPLNGAIARVLRFGMVALLATTLWGWAVYVSFWLTSKICGTAVGGDYHAFLSLGQPVLFVADAVWAVLFTHVAKRWESGRRANALFTLETAYKGVAIALLTLTLVVYATAPLWVQVLPAKFRAGRAVLGGLLMFFQVVIHLALMTILAKLHERPIVIALAGACAIAANVVLALVWLPLYGASGAALAAGVGTYLGAGAVTVGYFLCCRVKLAWSTYVVLAAPALLLLPTWLAGLIWAGVLAAAIFSPWVFDARQKRLLLSFLRRRRRGRQGQP